MVHLVIRQAVAIQKASQGYLADVLLHDRHLNFTILHIPLLRALATLEAIGKTVTRNIF